jgi:hypothetical protein
MALIALKTILAERIEKDAPFGEGCFIMLDDKNGFFFILNSCSIKLILALSQNLNKYLE